VWRHEYVELRNMFACQYQPCLPQQAALVRNLLAVFGGREVLAAVCLGQPLNERDVLGRTLLYAQLRRGPRHLPRAHPPLDDSSLQTTQARGAAMKCVYAHTAGTVPWHTAAVGLFVRTSLVSLREPMSVSTQPGHVQMTVKPSSFNAPASTDVSASRQNASHQNMRARKQAEALHCLHPRQSHAVPIQQYHTQCLWVTVSVRARTCLE
jgi:hypothetical protein